MKNAKEYMITIILLAIGLIYIFILYLLSSIIFKNFNVDRYVITMGIIGILTGAIGGILGINFKKGTHKHKHMK